MAVIRQVIGETIRATRLRQRRTLRQVSTAARVSLGYLSEIERGQKEPSSELLAAICAALDVRLSDLFAEVSDTMRREEKRVDVARHAAGVGGNTVGSNTVGVPPRLLASTPRRLTNPAAAGNRLAPPSGPVQPGATKRGVSRSSVPAS
jgi:transcriptional regulator with XRE-family HTH domain